MHFHRTAFALLCTTLVQGTFAADVTVFGIVDAGLTYTQADPGHGASAKSLEMSSGNYNANRVGLRGREDLGNGNAVGFFLESGWNTDDGAMKTSGKLFDRGAWLWFENASLGKLSMGRTGLLRAGTTPLNFFATGNRINPFGTGWSLISSPMLTMPHYDFLASNSLHYTSPDFSGVKIYAQYAFGGDKTGEEENKPNTDRYAAFGATLDRGAVHWMAMVDYLNEKSTGPAKTHDALTFSTGGNVDVGETKLYAWAQYFKDVDRIMPLPVVSGYSLFEGLDRITGYAATLGAKIPVASATKLNLSLTYLDAESDDDLSSAYLAANDDAMKRYGAFAGLEHKLSKRTTLYTALGWMGDKARVETAKGTYDDPQMFQAMAGINHTF